MKILELRIFRFDKDKDYESYFKPYIYDSWDNFATLYDLLLQVQDDDIYFSFEQNENAFVLINKNLIKLNTSLESIIQSFGFTLTIAPLCEKRAIKDFIIDKSDFLDKFQPFKSLVSNEDFKFYESLEHLYYTSRIFDFLPDFLGDSAIYFTAKMIEKYPNSKLSFLQILASEENGIFYHIKTQNAELEKAYDELLNELIRANLINQNLLSKAHKNEPLTLSLENIKFDFANFNIACFNFSPKIFKDKIKAKFITLESELSGFEFLKINKNLAYKIAANSLLEAYDGGADFMIVSNENEFYIFDECYKALQSASGRDFEDFYILKFDEFAALIKGERLASLSSHKLKVSL